MSDIKVSNLQRIQLADLNQADAKGYIKDLNDLDLEATYGGIGALAAGAIVVGAGAVGIGIGYGTAALLD